jgi:hypothetical protein
MDIYYYSLLVCSAYFISSTVHMYVNYNKYEYISHFDCFTL